MRLRTIGILVMAFLIAPTLMFAAGGAEKAGVTAAGPITLRVACYDTWYPPVSYTAYPPVWQEIEKRTGIKIKFEVADQYDTKMQTVIAAGKDLPDIMIVTPTWSNSGVFPLAQAGVIIRLDTLIAKDAPNISKMFAEKPEIRKQLTAPDGKIYSVADLPLQTVPMPFFIRKDWLDKLGLAAPVSIDDWYKVLKAFKQKDPNGNGQADEIPFSAIGGISLYFGGGFGLTSPVTPFWAQDGKVVYQYARPEFKDFLTFMNRLYSEGLYDQEINRNEADFFSLVSKNVVGSSGEPIDYLLRWDALAKGAGAADANTIPLPPPQTRDGKASYYVKRGLMWSHYGITKACKYPDEAMKWIDFVWANPEGLTIKEYGIEGTSYTKGPDGKPKFTAFILKNPDNLDPISAIRSLGGMPSIFVHDLQDSYNAKYEGTKVLTYTNQLQPTLILPYPDIMPTKDEYDRLKSLSADIDTYSNEMTTKFIMGQEPLSNFDQFVAQLKKMGIDQVLSIRQAQYDRYNK